MKKLLLLLAAVLAFTFTSVAQIGYSSGTDESDQTTKTTKEATVTGCVSKEPGANGMYALTNGHYKKGVEIGPTDKVKGHAGHTVQLTGQWSGKGAKKMFEVASLKHLSATCTMEGAKGK
ncbi:MAG: hypothetical protein LAN70_00965 [Acidobacteriia bacterium]|nr:hypothetical protein [Terriglobia bacterium]